MPMAMLMNPTRRKPSRRGKGKKRKARSSKMAKRRMPPRTKSGRFRKRKSGGRKVKRRKTYKRKKVTRKTKIKRRKKYARKARKTSGKSRTRAAAARKGWSRRKRGTRNYAKRRKGSGRRYFARNPFGIKGIPTLKQAQKMAICAARKGAGAVGTELMKATIYSTVLARFRPMGPTSVAEDTLARLGSAVATSVVAGYVGGKKLADEVLEGSFTVALYKLVADVFARATKGSPKLLGAR